MEFHDSYLDSIKQFLEGTICAPSLRQEYLKIEKWHQQIHDTLESNSIFLKLNSQALGFSNFIDIIIELFDRYQMDPEISPKVFKSWVRKILLEMKNHYYNLEHSASYQRKKK